ncbi:hypothetical protein FOA52_005779 [Chlamydomonas sp. UWO 241]|nr:hypothetical protein FOA52_005779 [Chlamydomonas sp. UWO 241]
MMLQWPVNDRSGDRPGETSAGAASTISVKARLSKLWGAVRTPSAHTSPRARRCEPDDTRGLVARSAQSVGGMLSRLTRRPRCTPSVSERGTSLDETSPPSVTPGSCPAKLFRPSDASTQTSELQLAAHRCKSTAGSQEEVDIDYMFGSLSNLSIYSSAATCRLGCSDAGAAPRGVCKECRRAAAYADAHALPRAASTEGGASRNRRSTGPLTQRGRFASAFHLSAALSQQVLAGAPKTMTRAPSSPSFLMIPTTRAPSVSTSSPTRTPSSSMPSMPSFSTQFKTLLDPTMVAMLDQHSVLQDAKSRERLIVERLPSLPSLPPVDRFMCSMVAGLDTTTQSALPLTQTPPRHHDTL